ncbi:MAG: FAD-dependent oxidoreductase, partial [Chloroflexi bacterium]|nr:FAD-dependent oxidoreductase [Chloroflexota bacterium]
TAMIELMGELGIAENLRWIRSTVGTYVGGKIYPFVTPTDLLRFSAIPLRDRLNLGLVTLKLRRQKDWRSLEAESAESWLKQHATSEAYRVWWEPMLRGKFGQFHDRVGMPWLWSKIQTRVASRKGVLGREMLGYPVNSFDEIFETLVKKIEAAGGRVLLSTAVTSVAVKNDAAVGLVARGPAGECIEESFDLVLATVPSFVFPKLVQLPDDYRARLSGVHYLAAVVVILELSRPLTDIYWMNIADRSVPFLGIIEHTNLMSRDLYGGNYVAYLTNYLDREDRLYRMSQDELLELYMPHLSKFNPEFQPSWVKRVHYNSVSAAQPIIPPGYSRMMAEHRTPIKRLWLANTTQIYPEDRGTNYSVGMGRKVARMIMDAAA